MGDPRRPEDMPREGWAVKAFSYEKGFGTLVHAPSGEEATFQADAWNIGDYRPSRAEEAAAGDDSPYVPREGESVRVTWRRSVLGKTVPGVVEPTSRVSTPRKEYTLAAWLKGVQKHAGKLTGVTAAKVVAALRKLDEDSAEEWSDGEPREADEYHFLLMDLGNVRDVDETWATTHCSWIHTDDHRWDRQRAQAAIASALSISPVKPAGDDESLSDYVARCNAVASANGAKELFYEVDLDADAHVFIAVTPDAMRALVHGGYVEVS